MAKQKSRGAIIQGRSRLWKDYVPQSYMSAGGWTHPYVGKKVLVGPERTESGVAEWWACVGLATAGGDDGKDFFPFLLMVSPPGEEGGKLVPESAIQEVSS